MVFLKNSIKRVVIYILGVIFFVTGVIGIFLPLLPTTPFILLAVGCFAKSSPTLHQKIMDHRYFGPMINDWQQHRCIPKKVKIKATFLIILSFSVSIIIVKIFYLQCFLLLMMVGLLSFIWSTISEIPATKN